ncbi:MAG TPA: deoxynucleoside kinase, partial [Candidatus Marinimicrobia bacterium]|nr:deoxynucleoside kinase [Candidatus Neomarinimicrobiota bacterium]
EKLGWIPYYESVADNPYLIDFYRDMSRWSFNLQVYFLHKRFKTHHEMSMSNGGVIQDRTIYEDVEIFARNLQEMNFMDKRDWENYRGLFSIMTSYLRQPDLIIYLKASTDTLLSRIKNRSRDYEKTIDPEYLHTLNVAYNKWINNIKNIPVLVIETDGFNIFDDKEKLTKILDEMQQRLA